VGRCRRGRGICNVVALVRGGCVVCKKNTPIDDFSRFCSTYFCDYSYLVIAHPPAVP